MLLVLGACVAVGCDQSDVGGRVLPKQAQQTGLPWKRVELRLLRGNLIDELPRLAAERRQVVVAEAQRRVLEAAKAERGPKADAFQRARATLGGDAGSVPEEQAGSLHARLAAAEARLVAARAEYDEMLLDLAPRLAAVGITRDTPARMLAQLRDVVQRQIANEARRLRDEYLSTQLVQQSGTVLAVGVGMDRLCWRAENKRDVALRFRGPIVLYNGRPLPESVADGIWSLPAKDTPLRIPNSRGVDGDLLLPGANFEACFYARGAALPLEALEPYGLASNGPTRVGEWHVQWQDITLVGDAGDRSSGESGLSEGMVFADRLRQFEAASEEGRLLRTLGNSTSGRTVKEAEAALLAIHQTIERQKAAQDVERVVQAIEAGKGGTFDVQVRMLPVVQQILHDPEWLEKWFGEAESFIDGRTVGRQEQNLGATYQFANLQPGRYTLLAKSTSDTAKPKLWVIPLEVTGHVARDLDADTAREMTLRKAYEDVFVGREL